MYKKIFLDLGGDLNFGKTNYTSIIATNYLNIPKCYKKTRIFLIMIEYCFSFQMMYILEYLVVYDSFKRTYEISMKVASHFSHVKQNSRK